jgi:hypothetical protein
VMRFVTPIWHPNGMFSLALPPVRF